jgi:hypothetical protein
MGTKEERAGGGRFAQAKEKPQEAILGLVTE